MSEQTPTEDVFDRLAGDRDSHVSTDAEAETGENTVRSGESDREPADEGAHPTSRSRVGVVLIGAIVVAALGLSAFLGWRLLQVDQTAAAGKAALEAAKSYAITLTTLDTNDIDKNYAEAIAGATGQFKDEYSQGSAQLRQILIDNKATGKGVVLDAAVKSATKTRVEVLLFVDQSVQNAVLSAPRVDRNRVQMTMELVDKRWLASNVEII